MRVPVFENTEIFKGWNITKPIIQGGMGVGVSRSSLAGAVALEGGIGVISTAQIGYDEPDFAGHESECNLRALRKHIQRAKEIACGKGMVAVNVMVALQHYKEHVIESAKAGADAIICGAGLPTELPELVKEFKTKIAPIVSSKKAASLILRMWDKRYGLVPDFIVVEGPHAGGHLGFNEEQLNDIENMDYSSEVKGIIEEKTKFENKYNKKIPVFLAGGIWDFKDALRVRELGADGVQAATRFVTTKECDASMEYKMAYVEAKKDDVSIIKSPVGMPGRALNNPMIKRIKEHKEKISRCYHCIKSCNPADIPYCITNALVNAVKGDVDNGLIFCGDNVERANKIETVKEVVDDIMYQQI